MEEEQIKDKRSGEKNAGEGKTKKPLYKRWWFWVIIIVVSASIIAAAASGGGNSNEADDGSSGTNGNTITGYYIGDTVTSGSVEFTVNSVSNETLLGSSVLGASTENNFIVVELKIKNIGNSEITLSSSLIAVKKGNSSYEPHSGSIYLENGFYIIKAIGSGISQTLVFAFETPTTSTADTYTLSIKGSSLSAKKEIVLASRPSN